MATISTGVVTQAESAKEALEQNNAAMTDIMATLKEHDIAAKDIQTSSFNITPVYDHSEANRGDPKVIGYRANNQVQVKIRNLSTLGDALGALVSAGSNQISGISFGVTDPAGIVNEARSKAIRDARHRAEVYAQAAGASVGQVTRISEQPSDPPRPLGMSAELRAAGSSVPIATGQEEFRVTVTVAYELLSSVTTSPQ